MRLLLSSLRARLIFLVLLPIIPLIALLLYSVLEQRRLAAAQVQSATLTYVDEITDSQEQIIDGAHQLLIGLAQLPEVRRHDARACNKLFSTILQRFPLYTNLAAVRPNGDVFCSGLPLKAPVNVAERPYFQETLQTHDFAISSYLIGRISGKPAIALAFPSLDKSDNVHAVVFVGVSITWLDRTIARMSLPPGSAVTLMDQEGKILYRHPDPEKWVGKPARGPFIKPDQLLAGQKVATEGIGMDGVPRIFAFSMVHGMPADRAVIVRVGIPKALIFAEANRTFRRDIAIMVLVILVALISAWAFSEQSLLLPIKSLANATSRLAAGDLGVRTGLPYNGGELGQLAESFDAMADALQTEEAKEAQALLALKVSEARYRSVTQVANDAIIIGDSRGNIIVWNNGAQRTFGYAEEEVLGRPLTLLMPQRYHEAHRRGLERFCSTGEARVIGSTTELEGLRKDGGEFPLELSLSSWNTGEGTFFSGIVHDITERKRREKEIRLSLERVRALHDIDVAMTSTLDLKGVLDVLLEKIGLTLPYSATTIRLFNKESGLLEPVACRNLDEQEWKTEKWKPGRGLANAVFETKAPVVILDAQTDPRVRDPEFYRKHRLVSYLGIPLTAKGETLGVLSFYTKEEHEFSNEEIEFLATMASQAAIAIHNSQLYEGMTKLAGDLAATNRRLESSLRELSGLYAAVAPLAPSESLYQLLDGIIDKLMKATGSDAALLRLRDTVTGKIARISQRGFPDFLLEWTDKITPGPVADAVFSGGEPVISSDIASDPRIRGKMHLEAGFRSCAFLPLKVNHGVKGMVLLSSRELGYFNEGQRDYLMSIARQMAIALENRALFDELRTSKDELERASKVKDEFLSVMSHELRTPLNVVVGYSGMMLDGILGEMNERQKEALQKIINRAADQLTLVNNILYATVLEGEKIKIESHEVDLKDFLHNLSSGYDIPTSRDLIIKFEPSPELPVIKTDGPKLKQILQNLIDNAVKFTKKGTVTVSARYIPEAKAVEFKVADTGIGISKDHLPLIFDKFRQVDSSETRLYGGVGIGLYIVGKFTEMLGGTVEVESEPNKGTTFTVTIPLQPSVAKSESHV